MALLAQVARCPILIKASTAVRAQIGRLPLVALDHLVPAVTSAEFMAMRPFQLPPRKLQEMTAAFVIATPAIPISM